MDNGGMSIKMWAVNDKQIQIYRITNQCLYHCGQKEKESKTCVTVKQVFHHLQSTVSQDTVFMTAERT